jgi:hypothetical protein
LINAVSASLSAAAPPLDLLTGYTTLRMGIDQKEEVIFFTVSASFLFPLAVRLPLIMPPMSRILLIE